MPQTVPDPTGRYLAASNIYTNQNGDLANMNAGAIALNLALLVLPVTASHSVLCSLPGHEFHHLHVRNLSVQKLINITNQQLIKQSWKDILQKSGMFAGTLLPGHGPFARGSLCQ